jgi:hypothetical protein
VGDEFVAIAAAFVSLFYIEAGDFCAGFAGVGVQGDAADDVVIDGHDVVVGDVYGDVFVCSGDEFGAADDATDHAEEFGDVVFA